MSNYLLVFRTPYDTMMALPRRSPEEMRENAKRWTEWINGIKAKNKLIEQGNRLAPKGQVVTSGNLIADGPYTEIKECLVGYTIVAADSTDEASALAKGCPILAIGGNVEVREILPPFET